MSLQRKIAWRTALINKAFICGRATNWPGVLKETFSTHSNSKSYATYSIVKSEGNFALYQVGAQKVWFPLAFDPSILGFIYHEIFEQRVYENGLCSIHPGDWVVDAGACEGFFSLYALDKGAKVLAFEPVPEIAQALERTLKSYIDAGRAKVFPLGLGSERGEKGIFLHSTNSGSATLNQTFRESRAGEDYTYQPIDVLIDTLDRVVSEFNISVSFLKADVEGYERELLKGARETICRCKPRLSICTYHLPDDFQAIPRIIQSFGAGYNMRFSSFFNHLYGW